MAQDTSVFIQLKGDYDDALGKTPDIAHLLIELIEINEAVMSKRELGYDSKGRLVHRWPCDDMSLEAPLFDPSLFDRSKVYDLSERDFDGLWDERISSEFFFTGAGSRQARQE